MTNNSTETWEVRARSKTTNTPQQATTAPVPRTPVDLTRNKELAMRAKMSVSHVQALLAHGQAAALRGRVMV